MKTIWRGIILLMVGFISYRAGYEIGRVYDHYKPIKVVDGDTQFMSISMSDEDRKVRILGIDAPELNECFGQEAKEFLGSMVNDKNLTVKRVGVDSFGRVVAKIIVGRVDVAPEILRNGMAKVDDASKDHIRADSKPTEEYLKVLRDAETVAKNKELGVWSKECVSKEPKRDESCLIKGNYRDGKKVYYLPSCSEYKNVVVEEQAGDKWLCSESDAKTLGFYLAGSCKK